MPLPEATGSTVNSHICVYRHCKPPCPPKQAQLPHLGLPQSSRALVAAVSLGHTPAKPWTSAYLQRFRTSLSELNPEGLVDVLRALASADALPSHQWLTEFEHDLERRRVPSFRLKRLGFVPLLDFFVVCQPVRLQYCTCC